MHDFYLSSKNRLCGIIFGVVLMAVSCTDPNTIGGPTNITGNGGNNSPLIPISVLTNRSFNGVDLHIPTPTDVVDYISIRTTPVVHALMSIKHSTFAFPAPSSKYEYLTSTLVLDSTYQKAGKAYLNLAESTFELDKRSVLTATNTTLFRWSADVVRFDTVKMNLPNIKLKTNFYVENYPNEENSIDVLPLTKITSPQAGAKIQRSAGLTIRWEQPIQYSESDAMLEARIFSIDQYTKAIGISQEKLDYSFLLVKSISPGATSIYFSSEDLAQMKGKECRICLSITSAKLVKNKTVALTAENESYVEIQIE
jgi:hypothetical protein